MHIML